MKEAEKTEMLELQRVAEGEGIWRDEVWRDGRRPQKCVCLEPCSSKLNSLSGGKHSSDCSFTPVALNTQMHHQPPHPARQTKPLPKHTRACMLTRTCKCAHMDIYISAYTHLDSVIRKPTHTLHVAHRSPQTCAQTCTLSLSGLKICECGECA